MQNIRLFLFATLGALLLLAWNAWQEDYAPRPTETATTSSQSAAPSSPNKAESQKGGESQGALPPAGQAPSTAAAGSGSKGGTNASVPATDSAVATNAPRVHVTTDLFDLQINTHGGGIISAKLRRHATSSDDPSPFALLKPANPVFVSQGGLVGKDTPAPGPNADWKAKQSDYRLAKGEDKLVVPLTWTGPDGVTVTRRYVFTRDSYEIEVENHVHNGSDTPKSFYQYTQLRRGAAGGGSNMLSAHRSYTGGVIYSPQDKYQQVAFDDMKDSPLSKDIKNGWAGITQHYFVAAVIPPRDVTGHYYTQVQGNDRVIGITLPWQKVAKGADATFSDELYVGPKSQDRLAAAAKGLELTVDYGWLTIISKPLFVVLSWIHDVIGNWGWSIIILTMLIKAVFFKLSETSYRSMARMRKLQPRMKELKERFSDDREKMNQELMGLYKTEKVNPLGGCLPIVVQIPVFIALYWMILETVELRQAPWILWIHDLSSADPYYVLPIIMGITMLLQQRLNPAPMDPIQKRVMSMLPVVFTFFFLFFPAGLVLYWITNNSLSILQQWVITRRIEAGEDTKGAKPAKAKKLKTEK